METPLIEPENHRGRKRKAKHVETPAVGGGGGREKVMRTRSSELVGRYVRKEFKGSGVLLGRIVNHESGLYGINYEDGRFEELVRSKIKPIMVEDGDLTDEWSKRKEALNGMLLSKDANLNFSKKTNSIDSSSLSGMTNCCNADDGMAGVHNDCSDEGDAREENGKLVPVRPPELPPSSGDIGVPVKIQKLKSEG